MIDKHGWQGIFKMSVNGAEEEIVFNRVMNVALDELLKPLQGLVPNLEIKYLALGTSSVAVADVQTQLGAEIFRAQFTNKTKTNTGELTSLAYLLSTEAVAVIEEIGVFGGSTATAAANSGTLISRILWHRNKTNLEEIQFTRIDRIVRS